MEANESQWGDSALRYATPPPGQTSASFNAPRTMLPSGGSSLAAFDDLASEPRAVRVVRRAADIYCAVAGLILTSPMLLAVIIAIRLDSKGPVIFRQPRVGRNGAVFMMVKFRTMFTDAEQRQHELECHNESIGGVLFKMQSDPRVTRVGRQLRRLNIDEVPQLLNVLRGQMSLVGPRPLPLRDSDLLATLHPLEYRSRLVVRPGITGEWQVRRNGDSDYWHMLLLDMEYLRTRSLQHDGFLAAKTVLVLLKASVSR